MSSVGGGLKGFYRQKKNKGVGVSKSNTFSASSKKKAATALSFAATDPIVHLQGEDNNNNNNNNNYDLEEKVLRDFDLDMRYGPCLGMTRMERWDRASSMGLNPPADVEAILLKSAATGEDRLHCLWEGRI